MGVPRSHPSHAHHASYEGKILNEETWDGVSRKLLFEQQYDKR